MKGGVSVEYLMNLPYSRFIEETAIVQEMITLHNKEIEKANKIK